MEGTVVAAITGALAALAAEVARGTASEAGKDAWRQIKRLLGPEPEAALDRAQTEITNALEADPGMVQELLQHLNRSESVRARQLVGHIDAKKVVVADIIEGDVKM